MKYLVTTALFSIYLNTFLIEFNSIFAQMKVVEISYMASPIFDLASYKKFAISPADKKNNNSYGVLLDLEDEISKQLIESGKEIIERSQLEIILNEHRLSNTGIVDESGAVEFGKISGAEVLFIIRLSYNNFIDNVEARPMIISLNGCATNYVREGTYTLGFTVKAVETKTGKVIGTKELKAQITDKESALCNTPAEINVNRLYTACFKSIQKQSNQLFNKHPSTYSLSFFTKSKLDNVESAIGYLKIRNSKEAINLLKKDIEAQNDKPKLKAKALFNYAMALVSAGQNKEALQQIEEAYVLEQLPIFEKWIILIKNSLEDNQK